MSGRVSGGSLWCPGDVWEVFGWGDSAFEYFLVLTEAPKIINFIYVITVESALFTMFSYLSDSGEVGVDLQLRLLALP